MTVALVIFIGAGFGAVLRWGLSLKLNSLWPGLQYGTLAANLLGCWLLGVALEVFNYKTSLSQEVRLMATTGFLGGLTTFSTFSGEVCRYFMEGRPGPALMTITLNLFGSLGATVLGIQLGRLFFKI